MIEALITILAGAAGGIGGKIATFAFEQGIRRSEEESDTLDNQAIQLIDQVGQNAKSAEEISTTLHGFTIEYDQGMRSKSYTHSPENNENIE
jgi:hypothetical protein